MSLADFFLKKAEASAQSAESVRIAKRENRAPESVGRKRIIRNGDRRAWTPEEEDFLEANGALGCVAIGERLGRTPNAVKVRACRLGISLPGEKSKYVEWTPELFETIRRHYDSGMKYKQIGAVMNMTENQVRGACIRLGLSGRKHKWTTDEVIAVARYLRKDTENLLSEALDLEVSRLWAKYSYIHNKKEMLKHRKAGGRDLLLAYCNKKNIVLPVRNK